MESTVRSRPMTTNPPTTASPHTSEVNILPSGHTDRDAEMKAEKHESEADRMCWMAFVGATVLAGSMAAILVYTTWVSPPPGYAVTLYTFEYYVLCAIGGVLSGLPHTWLTPLDLIKCRVQVGEYSSFMDGYRSLSAEAAASRSYVRSAAIFFRGWAPTFIGYSCQGAMKFCLYEFFKHFYGARLDAPQVVVFLVASMTAELFADVSLAPWEAVKIKMQTTRHYPPYLRVVVPRMWSTEGIRAFYKGLTALWARQVPYTMMKFASFEKIVGILYFVFVPMPKVLAPKHVQLTVTVAAGLLAGALCALVSHPADTVVSKLNQRSQGDMKGTVMQYVASLGCAELWKGLLPRIAMIGVLTSIQWLIYDSFKVAVGLPTTGSAPAGLPAHHHLSTVMTTLAPMTPVE